MQEAVIVSATSGLAPKDVLMMPVKAVRRLSQKIDWRLDQVDLFELNEAFSVHAIAVLREVGIDPGKVNVSGGAPSKRARRLRRGPLRSARRQKLRALPHRMAAIFANPGLRGERPRARNSLTYMVEMRITAQIVG